MVDEHPAKISRKVYIDVACGLDRGGSTVSAATEPVQDFHSLAESKLARAKRSLHSVGCYRSTSRLVTSIYLRSSCRTDVEGILVFGSSAARRQRPAMQGRKWLLHNICLPLFTSCTLQQRTELAGTISMCGRQSIKSVHNLSCRALRTF